LTVLALFTSAELSGQSQPDFSGRWAFVLAEPTDAQAAGTLIVQQPIVRTNVHGGPMQPFFKSITIERQFVNRTHTDVYELGVQGGRVGGPITADHDPLTAVPQTRYFVRWEDNRLVMDTGSYAGSSREAGPYIERTETWQIDDSGMLVVTITDRASAMEPSSHSARYRRL